MGEPTEPQQGSDLTITTTTPPLVIDSASPSSEEQSQEGSLSEESQEGSLSEESQEDNLSEPGIRRRRLVEAAYFAFITPPLVIDSASPSSEEQSQEGSLS